MTRDGRVLACLAAGAALLGVAGCANPAPSPAPTVTPTASVPTAAPTAVPTASAPTASAGSPAPTVRPSDSTAPVTSFDPNRVALSVEPFADGFQALTFLANAGDGSGRLYAVEQRGAIWQLDADGTVGGEPFLDITDRVASGGERGLLGLAFHPDYAANGRLFVDYTDLAGNTVVSEFLATPDGAADAASERVLLGIAQPFANHNGGMIAFGPDGYLYIGTGDGGSRGDPFGNGQNLASLLGKILRLDVDSGDPYAIPADNPFAAGTAGQRPEIWSYGLRNPWRFSFDPLTGAMFIGDVGQNAWEEVDAEPAGQGGRNYGWNVMEADRCYAQADCARDGLVLPVAAYSHEVGCSVTGGYVYRGSRFAALDGGYVFADYCAGLLWAFDAQGALEAGTADVVQVGAVGFNTPSFGEDEAGELYVVDLAGAIYRLVAESR